jgi:hypothetical protein
MKTVKIMRHEAGELDGVIVPYCIGRDGAGREMRFAIPADGLQDVYADAERRALAYVSQKGEEVRGKWRKMHYRHSATRWNVGRIEIPEGEKVAVIIDQGLPTELAYVLPLDQTPAQYKCHDG